MGALVNNNPIDVIAFVAEVSRVAEKLTGVQLGEKQFEMVKSRLSRRAVDLGLNSIENYTRYYYDNEEKEKAQLISMLTTHHTFFFREFQQFQYLETDLLPTILPKIRARPDKKLRIWSAACSRGQEVYSLTMFLKIVLAKLAPDVTFEISGSDVDPESVAIATNGVYLKSEINDVPMSYLGNHWAKGSGDIASYVKAKGSLRDHCKFFSLNLFADTAQFPRQKFDLIFCRNVFIYFTKIQIEQILTRFQDCLEPHGFLMVGISESLMGTKSKFESMGRAVYRFPLAKVAPGTKPVVTSPATLTVAPAPMPAKKLRVFSIDDSPTIHSLLKQILSKSGDYELVGSAINGKEAAELLPKANADVVTLDIHMPEVNGIEYLQRNFNSKHPPVVMLSSVSREEGDLAFQALSLGASDYVEKPALANLEERGEEIRLKLRAAFDAKNSSTIRDLSMDQAFAKIGTIQDPGKCAVIVLGTMSQTKQWQNFMKEWGSSSAPVYFLVEGGTSGLQGFSKKLSQNLGKVEIFLPESTCLKPGQVAIGDMKTSLPKIRGFKEHERVAILAYRGVSKKSAEEVLRWSGANLFVEEVPAGSLPHPLEEAATDKAPATSFAYFCKKALVK